LASEGNPDITMKLISEWLGHSSIVITFNIYGHLLPKRQKIAADKLDEYIG